ncbi:TIGR03773 family transporter-associated surface protein [Streptomyces solisilvae]|uniref:TIGR03773 family transporter-associated surface protein n=1 Tax=Streptomyces malaysiensis TaxID=92644 RepID=UPI0036BB6148
MGSLAIAAGVAPAATADSPKEEPGRSSAAVSADVVLALEGDTLSLDLKQPGAADGTDLTVGADARTTVPEGGRYDFLGRPGSAVWLRDGTEAGTGGAPVVPEWDTTAVPAGSVEDGTVEWALTGVQGPGHVSVFEPASDATSATPAAAATSDTGPEVLFDSRDGLPDARHLSAGDTGATVWAFTEPGEYRVTSQATARLISGAVTTATAEWTVNVAADSAQATAAPAAPTPSTSSPSSSAGEPSGSATLATSETVTRSAADAAAADISTEKVVIDDGHVDAIAGKMVDGTLRTLFKDSRDPADIVWREPSSVVLHVTPQAKQQVPGGDSYAFLGESGSDFWLIPQVQQQGVVWAGWNTESLTSNGLKGPVDMALTKVSGPGSLAIWETAGLGAPDVLYNSEDGLPDSQKVNLGVHAHANWAFSKAGTYKVTFRLSGTLASGKTASDTRTYTFAVGDVDPDTVTPGGDEADGGATGGSGDDTTATGSGDGAASSGAGGAGTDATADGDGSLAHTGSGAALPLGVGAGALVITGAAVVGSARRRHEAASDAEAARS